MRDARAMHAGPSRLAFADALMDRLLHDLKQPLNLIRVTAQDLRLDVQRNRFAVTAVVPDMRQIEQAVDELVVLVDRLRTFVRPKPARPASVVVDANEVCRAARERLRDAGHVVEVVESFAPDLPLLMGDPLGLEQAVWELLDNGVQAALDAKRPVQIQVSTARRGTDTVIAVSDNGAGVAAAISDKIFTPFFTTRASGAGLGLALAHAVVEGVGGRITLAQSSPAGSCFELLLPTERPSASETVLSPRAVGASASKESG